MRLFLSIVVSCLAVCVTSAKAHAQIFVSELIGTTGRVGEFTTSGVPINPALISERLHSPIGLALSGNHLFVLNSFFATTAVGAIGEYTTSGATINPTLISGLNHNPFTIGASGDQLFVANRGDTTVGSGTISLFTTSGEKVNPALISGLSSPLAIAISGGRLFVANSLTDTVGEYYVWGDTESRAHFGIVWSDRHRHLRRQAFRSVGHKWNG
jgi:DNA-binding beta-propeller fold protein YncE